MKDDPSPFLQVIPSEYRYAGSATHFQLIQPPEKHILYVRLSDESKWLMIPISVVMFWDAKVDVWNIVRRTWDEFWENFQPGEALPLEPPIYGDWKEEQTS